LTEQIFDLSGRRCRKLKHEHIRGVVRAENLNPGVLVMQPANQGVRHDASNPLNRA